MDKVELRAEEWRIVNACGRAAQVVIDSSNSSSDQQSPDWRLRYRACAVRTARLRSITDIA